MKRSNMDVESKRYIFFTYSSYCCQWFLRDSISIRILPVLTCKSTSSPFTTDCSVVWVFITSGGSLGPCRIIFLIPSTSHQDHLTSFLRYRCLIICVEISRCPFTVMPPRLDYLNTAFDIDSCLVYVF